MFFNANLFERGGIENKHVLYTALSVSLLLIPTVVHSQVCEQGMGNAQKDLSAKLQGENVFAGNQQGKNFSAVQLPQEISRAGVPLVVDDDAKYDVRLLVTSLTVEDGAVLQEDVDYDEETGVYTLTETVPDKPERQGPPFHL